MGESVNKMSGNEVILTTDHIRQWQADIEAAEEAKAKADATIADRRKKLDAAAVFGVRLDPVIPEASGEVESMRAAVERILGGFDRAIQHHQLQTELRKTPRFAEMLDKHKAAYYYTLIKRLADDKKIKRVGRKLRLIHKNEAPPEGNPESAS